MEEEEEGEKKVVDEEEKDAKMKMARSINGITGLSLGLSWIL